MQSLKASLCVTILSALDAVKESQWLIKVSGGHAENVGTDIAKERSIKGKFQKVQSAIEPVEKEVD